MGVKLEVGVYLGLSEVFMTLRGGCICLIHVLSWVYHITQRTRHLYRKKALHGLSLICV